MLPPGVVGPAQPRAHEGRMAACFALPRPQQALSLQGHAGACFHLFLLHCLRERHRDDDILLSQRQARLHGEGQCASVSHPRYQQPLRTVHRSPRPPQVCFRLFGSSYRPSLLHLPPPLLRMGHSQVDGIRQHAPGRLHLPHLPRHQRPHVLCPLRQGPGRRLRDSCLRAGHRRCCGPANVRIGLCCAGKRPGPEPGGSLLLWLLLRAVGSAPVLLLAARRFAASCFGRGLRANGSTPAAS
mmetsp:Transcript_2270/g.5326  ORF Transcript_2270/g.5326 Transcript_2270/m.5326 type:complete len:241 (+) Transcript_2270:624-1346(+)